MQPQACAFEAMLAQHCAPALTGLAPANLVSLAPAEFPQLSALVEEYREQLASAGVALYPMCRCRRRLLLLVGRPQALERQLTRPYVATFLARLGYPVEKGLEACLRHLRRRLRASDGFPHEIGLFLGYPLADVLGFCALGGECAKLCGYWKVYGDVDYAKACFQRFDESRAFLCRGLREGRNLVQLLGLSPSRAA